LHIAATVAFRSIFDITVAFLYTFHWVKTVLINVFMKPNLYISYTCDKRIGTYSVMVCIAEGFNLLVVIKTITILLFKNVSWLQDFLCLASEFS
jgi:hypothetical protein